MKKINGFTLVELLAVIVILAIILAIAIPGISGIVKSSTKSAFETDAKLVLKAIDYKRLENNDFDPTQLNQNNIGTLLGLSDQNYSSLNITREDGIEIINIVGKGKWNGLVACGTYHNVKVVESASDCGGDLVPPVITLLGDNPVNIFVGETYSDAGVTAIDNVDGNVTSNVVTTGSVNPNAQGTYTITYSVTDTSGNTATLSRTINVIDNLSPTISFNPNGNTMYAQNRTVTVSVTDVGVIDNNSLKYVWTTSTTRPLDSDFMEQFTNGGTINTPSLVSGSYYLWVMAMDTASNQTVTSSLVFNLDNAKPVITLNGLANVTIGRGSVYSDAGATATDNADTNVTVVASGTVNVNVIGTYTITYNATDASGNTATPITRTINVVDASAPVITILGSNPVTINKGGTYSDAGATALDDVDGNLTSSIITTGSVNPNAEGTYTITYTVSDTAGNQAVATRTVNVVIPSTPENCFTFNSSTGTITNYDTGCGTNVVIPSTIGGVPVTTLGIMSFYNKGLTSFVIPNTVTSIQDMAVSSNQITTLTIPGNVVSIGFEAFRNNSISSLTLQSGVKTINNAAFERNQLTSITIPSSVTMLGGGSFNDNKLPDAQAFIYARGAGGSIDTSKLVSYGGTKRSGVVVPSNVVTIGLMAFEYNQLTSVTIPNSVTTIEDNAFFNNLLTSITIPNSVTSIGDGAFWKNSIAGTVTIPNGVTYIGQGSFSENNLTGVSIPNTVTTIGNVAFQDNALSSLSIPSSVSYIGAGAFNNNNLPDAQAFIFARTAGGAIDTTKLISYGGAKKTGVVIPSSTKSIGYNTFGKQELVSVTIPNGVLTIGDNSFTDNLLTSIAIPNSVTNIYFYAFAFNYIPQGAATIDNSPGSVTISSSAFDYNVNRNATITPVYLR